MTKITVISSFTTINFCLEIQRIGIPYRTVAAEFNDANLVFLLVNIKTTGKFWYSFVFFVSAKTAGFFYCISEQQHPDQSVACDENSRLCVL